MHNRRDLLPTKMLMRRRICSSMACRALETKVNWHARSPALTSPVAKHVACGTQPHAVEMAVVRDSFRGR